MTELPRVLGHRGALAQSPENTFPSFRRAMADGAHGFEFDVRLCADGTPVVLHDATVDRTTNGSGFLSEHDLASLARLDAGGGERIPTVDAVLDEFLDEAVLNLELKEVLPPAALARIGHRLRQCPGAEVLLSSFDSDALVGPREHLPEFPRAQLLHEGEDPPSEADATALSLSGVVARQESLSEAWVAAVRARGLSVYAYVVDRAERAIELGAWGVAGIVSDDPGRLLHDAARLRASGD